MHHDNQDSSEHTTRLPQFIDRLYWTEVPDCQVHDQPDSLLRRSSCLTCDNFLHSNSRGSSEGWIRPSNNSALSLPTAPFEAFKKVMHWGETLLANVGGMYRETRAPLRRSTQQQFLQRRPPPAVGCARRRTTPPQSERPQALEILLPQTSMGNTISADCGVTLRFFVSSSNDAVVNSMAGYFLAKLRGSPGFDVTVKGEFCVDVSASVSRILDSAERHKICKMNKEGVSQHFAVSHLPEFLDEDREGFPSAPLTKNEVALVLFNELASLRCDDQVPYVSFSGASLLGVCSALGLIQSVMVNVGSDNLNDRNMEAVQSRYGGGLAALLAIRQQLRRVLIVTAAFAGAAAAMSNLSFISAVLTVGIVLGQYPLATPTVARALTLKPRFDSVTVEPFPVLSDTEALRLRFLAYLKSCTSKLGQEKIECALHPAVREAYDSAASTIEFYKSRSAAVGKSVLLLSVGTLLLRNREGLINYIYEHVSQCLTTLLPRSVRHVRHVQSSTVCLTTVLACLIVFNAWQRVRVQLQQRDAAVLQVFAIFILGMVCMPRGRGHLTGDSVTDSPLEATLFHNGAIIFESVVAFRSWWQCRSTGPNNTGEAQLRAAQRLAINNVVDTTIAAFCPMYPRLALIVVASLALSEVPVLGEGEWTPMALLLWGMEFNGPLVSYHGSSTDLFALSLKLTEFSLVLVAVCAVAAWNSSDWKALLLVAVCREFARWGSGGLMVVPAREAAPAIRPAVVPVHKAEALPVALEEDKLQQLNRFLGTWRVDLDESDSMDGVSKLMGVSWAIRRAFAKFTPSCIYERPEEKLLVITSLLPLGMSRSTDVRVTGEEYLVDDKDVGCWKTCARVEGEKIVVWRVRMSDGLHVTETRAVQTRANAADGNPRIEADKLHYFVQCRRAEEGPVEAQANRYFDRLAPPPSGVPMPWQIAGDKSKIRMINSLDELQPATPVHRR